MPASIFGISRSYDTAVEIDKSYIKISQADFSSKGVVITRLITEPIAGLSDEEISKTLADIIAINNIKIDKLTAIISKEKTMARYIRVPSTSSGEIDNMVSFEVTRQIPYTREEVIADYEVINTDSEGYSNIMLAIIHKNEFARLNSILSSAAKSPYRVRLSSNTVLGWLRIAAPGELVGKEVCLVNVDADTTEIMILKDARLEFSRVVSIGAGNILQTKANAFVWRERLMDEIRRSVDIYKKDKSKSSGNIISKFLITGASSVVGSLSSFLEEQMRIPCQPINVLSTLNLTDGALTEKGVLEETSVCAVCGSFFVSEGINLIPEEQRKKDKVQLKVKRLTAVFILSAIILALMFMVAIIRLYQKQSLLDKTKRMFKEIEPIAKSTEDKLKKLNLVKHRFCEGTSSLDVLYNLYQLMPDNISLVDFVYEEDKRAVRFRGTAGRTSDVFKLVGILKGSKRFGNVETRSVSERRTTQEEIVDFQIRCNFIGPEAKK